MSFTSNRLLQILFVPVTPSFAEFRVPCPLLRPNARRSHSGPFHGPRQAFWEKHGVTAILMVGNTLILMPQVIQYGSHSLSGRSSPLPQWFTVQPKGEARRA